MSKDMEDTIKEIEKTIDKLDAIANQNFSEAEQKFKKGIVQGSIWILVTVGIYFIWGTTWFFWVSLGLNVISIGAMVFAKVIMAKAKKKMAERDDKDYDFTVDVSENKEDTDDIIVLETKIFGKQEYSSENGLDFDEINMKLNNKVANFSGMIFEDLNEVQIKKAVKFLDFLEEIDAIARRKWLELLKEKDKSVCGYINIHHDDYGDEIRDKILKKLKVEKQDNIAFIENLEFGSFHITEGDEEESIELVMDYALIWESGYAFTDQILAMHFNEDLEYEMHTHDS